MDDPLYSIEFAYFYYKKSLSIFFYFFFFFVNEVPRHGEIMPEKKTRS